MRIAVLGTGIVGRSLASRLVELGHTVTMGTRDPDATRTRPDHAELPGIPLRAFAEAARDVDLVVNATPGTATLDVLAAVGGEALTGVVLMDVANPLDLSGGFPPTLAVANTDSLAEQVQRTFPGARVVKALNTMNAAVMVHPDSVAGGQHTTFVAGDDSDAKRVVVGLLGALGHRDVLDLGDLSAARGMEMFLPLWIRVMQTLGTATFQVKVAR